MMCINLNIGLITPPVGACLFVAPSVAKVKFEEFVGQIWLFILVEIAVFVLVTCVPAVTLTIPSLLGLLN